MSLETIVAQHYTSGILEQSIIAALRQAGKDPDRLDPDDLALVDEFHHGGRTATVAFAPRLGLRPGIFSTSVRDSAGRRGIWPGNMAAGSRALTSPRSLSPWLEA